jgi:biopolymer transport protein ExbB
MGRAVIALALLAGCSFMPRAAGVGDASHDSAERDAPALDAPDGAGSDGGGATARRKPIVIDKTKVGGPVDDFPVWIDLTDTQIAVRARADGHDIYFTDSQGIALDREMVSYSSGHLLAWVRAPHLDMMTTVTIYVVYGDITRTPQQNPAGVFAGYAAVWHLDDSLATSAVADATNTYDGTATGLAPTAQVAAKLGGGITFDGTGNQNISFTSPLTGTGAHTISAWVDQQATNRISAIVTVGTSATDSARFLYGNYGNAATVGVGLYNDDWVPAGHDLRGAGWKLVHWTYEGSNKRSHVYVDGHEITGSPQTMDAAANTPASTGTIGYAPEPAFGNPTGMVGVLDEVRIATATRSPGWIATEFANQDAPSTFYAIGAEQVAP